MDLQRLQTLPGHSWKRKRHKGSRGGLDGIYLAFDYICLSDFSFSNIVTTPPLPPLKKLQDPSVTSDFGKTCLLRGFTFEFILTIIISVFVPGRSRVVQKLKKWVFTGRDRPGTKTEIIIRTINVTVHSEEDTFVKICSTVSGISSSITRILLLSNPMFCKVV